MARTPHHVIAVVALGVAALLSACSDGDAEDATPRAHVTTTATTAPPTTASTTTKPLTPEEQVKAAYIEAMRTYYERLTDPDPSDPRLRELFAQPLLAHVLERNADLLAKGERLRFTDRGVPTPFDVMVSSASAADAEVTGCLINDAVRFRASDGLVVDDAVVSLLYRARLTLDGSSWRLADQEVVAKHSGSQGC